MFVSLIHYNSCIHYTRANVKQTFSIIATQRNKFFLSIIWINHVESYGGRSMINSKHRIPVFSFPLSLQFHLFILHVHRCSRISKVEASCCLEVSTFDRSRSHAVLSQFALQCKLNVMQLDVLEHPLVQSRNLLLKSYKILAEYQCPWLQKNVCVLIFYRFATRSN